MSWLAKLETANSNFKLYICKQVSTITNNACRKINTLDSNKKLEIEVYIYFI